MIPSELERLVLKAKEEGKHPYFVNATAGTTVFGAFDPINELADICDKYEMWLHIDVSSLNYLIK
jgi:glutamate decarboxylase